jgi:peptide/nickel transport system substrate-binding protein
MSKNLFPLATGPAPTRTSLAIGRRLLLGAAFFCVAAVLSLTHAYAADKETLVIASGADAVTLDPGVSFDGQSVLLWRGVYETLLKYKDGTTEIVPNLAESYSISADKLTYTFKIRKGIRFQDGETLDAAAVKFNIDRQIAIKQGIAYALAPITKIDTPDDSTVVLHLSAPSDGLLSAFAGLYTVEMISPKAIKDHTTSNDWGQAWLRDHMVGTGPYMLQGYTQSQQAVFTRNPNYWRGWDGDHFQRVIVKYVHEPSTEQLLLQQGEIDVALFLPDDVVESLDGKPGIRVTNVPSFNLYYIVLPTKKGPTANVKVRQAIAYGLNYQAFVKDMLRGKAKQARGPLPSNFLSFNPDIPQYGYDPAKAKRLLAEAGYPNGGFTIKYVYESGYWWKRPLGELFQSNMKDLGITVEIQEMSPSAWAATLSNPDTAGEAFGLVWWPTLATPYDYMWSIFDTQAQGSAGYNWGYYSNPKLDKLLDAASAEPDDAKRMQMYGEAQKLLVEESPALYVYEKNYRLPMSDKLQGFVFNGIYIETIDFYAVHKG